MGSSNSGRNSIMWLKLVATGVTILSHFQEEVDQRVSGALSTGTRANSHSNLSDWLPTWRCMMQKREAAAYGGVGGVGNRRRRPRPSACLLTQSLNRWGSLHDPTCRSTSLPSCSSHYAAPLGRKASRRVHGACSTYYTQTGSPSWEGQSNVIVRFHLGLSEEVMI